MPKVDRHRHAALGTLAAGRQQVAVTRAGDHRFNIRFPLVADHVVVGHRGNHRFAQFKQVIQHRNHEADQRLAGL